MNIDIIIKQLQTECVSLEGRVAGAAEFKMLKENTSMPVPCAFVIPMEDNPEDNMSQNGIRQMMTESFAVVVALSNIADERGQTATTTVDAMRTELWAALLGFRPSDDGKSCNSPYKGIAYEGKHLLGLDRARAWYQFEFGADMEIGPEDGWQRRENAALPHLDGITIKVDFIEPSETGTMPDGQIDSEVRIPKSGNFP